MFNFSQTTNSVSSSTSIFAASAFNAASQGSASVSTGLETFTKKVSGAISAIPLKPDMKRQEEDKKVQYSKMLSLLEGIRLQSPQTHAGLVVVFTATSLSPLGNSGWKFNWYRTSNSTTDNFHGVDESSRAWYAPTADDIGCKICVQCEDVYEQGLSRYLEVRLSTINL